ncbi:hypothetical protein IFT43_05740 [Oxalobacteraceae sp. CFBP 13708]|nr:hypothetical protein [Oxalobacteraceae sp. CFBP 13708]
MTLTCDVCEKDIDFRLGMSNRDIQPFSLACPHCSSLINITISRGKGTEIDGAKQLADRQYGLFDGRNPFVDMHLDFPVYFGRYIMGMTPFIRAFQMVDDSIEELGIKDSMEALSLHNSRLNQLNILHEKRDKIRTIIRLYHGQDKQLFNKQVAQFLKNKENKSLKPQDVNATLYQFLSFVFRPFVFHSAITEFIHEFGEFMMRLAHSRNEALNSFIDRLHETKFLHTVQRDCLKLYPEIYDAELPLRPAFLLDFISGYERNKVAARVSNEDFATYKDLYKDIAEVLGRQLVLVAALNNIFHRGNYNEFAKPEHGNALSSLDKFADKTLSEKFKYLDDCWYNINKDVVDTGVRNAIAHYTATYDSVSQIITYYPEKEGVRQEQGEVMYFLDFMRMILQLFREVHYLHHVIKSLFYYEYLIRSKERNN